MQPKPLPIDIHRILPNYDMLPDMLEPWEVAKLIHLETQTLAADRCGARRLGIGWIKIGRNVIYPKAEVAKYLLKNAQGFNNN
jgi:hypothetical protein